MKFVLQSIAIIFIIMGCSKHQSKPHLSLGEIEYLIESSPDSALNLSKKMQSLEKLSNRTFAYSCMLSGKIADKFKNKLPQSDQLEKAKLWYLSYGMPDEQVQIHIYLGRSYETDGLYDKAMSIYTNAIEIAQENDLDNFTGYIYSYMGDLYGKRAMQIQAINKYKEASKYFKKEKNTNSYVCALRDMGREYARMDSIECALQILSKADSISNFLNNNNIKSSITNSLGNIHLLQQDYDKAKVCFSKAIASGQNKLPNYVALIQLYIITDSIQKAKELLENIPHDNPEYTYSIKNLYYQIYSSERNYKEALSNLEEYTQILDSIAFANNQQKILDIESRYNHLKNQKEINDLKIKQQNYIIILIIFILISLLMTLVYILYHNRVQERIEKQQTELNKIKIELLNSSLELEKKKRLLATFKEKNNIYTKMQEEINSLSANYRKLQNKLLSESSLYNELKSFSNQNIPSSKKTFLTNARWKQITAEITAIYPNFYLYINRLCPDITEQDWQYCCFYMFGFDTNAEARLLNITPNSVRTKHLRLRQKLNIILPSKTTLYEYLIENLN